jgi:hypothetical protein
MAKKKNYGKSTQPLIDAATGNPVEEFFADAVEAVFNCTDGAAMVQKHMQFGVEALHAYVTLVFASLMVAKLESPETFGEPAQPTIDYLVRACRLLGLAKVADAFSSGIDAALDAFRDAPVDLDIASAKNARAMDLLIK